MSAAPATLLVTGARVRRWAIASLAIGGSVMALAGEWTSPYLWAFAVGTSAALLYGTLGVLDSDLAQERFRPPTPGADAGALRWVRLTALLTLVLAPLDAGRFHWSSPMPPALRVIGICAFLAGFWFVLRAMAVNRFFSAVVRIQAERGHRVIDQGPYSIIRHPGYVGMIVVCPAAALALGSWWALVPAGLYSALILRRVVAEDQFLHEHLPGYVDYAKRVKFRIAPGIW